MSGWGAPVKKDDGTAIIESEKPEDVNPTLLVDQTMGATLDQVRQYDHTGVSMTKGEETAMNELVLKKDADVTRTTYAEQPITPDSHDGGKGMSSGTAYGEPGGESAHNFDDHTMKASMVVQSEFTAYKYHMKEVVLATNQNPPGPESSWKMGKVFEFMLGDQIKVKLRSGEKIIVSPNFGQIRPMSENEQADYKATHRGEAEMPMWAMVVFFPCIAVAAPFYFFGCCGADAAVTDCCDVCEPCFEACECCCEICEECCECCC